jgi:hypothetical protein
MFNRTKFQSWNGNSKLEQETQTPIKTKSRAATAEKSQFRARLISTLTGGFPGSMQNEKYQ